MNEGYFMGKVIEVGKFKFIYGKDLSHKSVIVLKIELFDNQIIQVRGYDEIADKILRSEFEFVCIRGILRTEGFIQILEIEKVYI